MLPENGPRDAAGVQSPDPTSPRPPAPLSLSRDMRARLRQAVSTLLASPGLAEAGDAASLALIVLASRTAFDCGLARTRTSELARWLGLSPSYLASEVLPALRHCGAVRTRRRVDPHSGRDIGLDCAVMPLWQARHHPGHPLALTRAELATLLRLLTAVFGPGWQHRDGTRTEPGLLGGRRGRGAATDRLALLLLVLDAGPGGRVRLCPGRVDTRRGRPAATLARLLRCEPSRAQRVLARLESAGVLQREHTRTSTGARGKGSLQIPAVAAACTRPAARRRGGQNPRPADLPPAALPDLHGLHGTATPTVRNRALKSVQVSGPRRSAGPVAAQRAAAASLHSASTLQVFLHQVEDGEEAGCSGGSAAVAGHRRPERPHPREMDRAGAVVARSLGGDRGVAAVLAPVAHLCRILRPGARRRLAREVRAELDRVAEVVGPARAGEVLADRMARRLRELGPSRVRDPLGWVLGRALPRRPQCADVRCDDGRRLDAPGACPSCQVVLADRRALRRSVALGAAASLPGADTVLLRAETERRLRELAELRATELVLAQAQRAARAAQLSKDIEEHRRAGAAAARPRSAQNCARCGKPEAAGLCPPCHLDAVVDAELAAALALARGCEQDPRTDAAHGDRQVREAFAHHQGLQRTFLTSQGAGPEVLRLGSALAAAEFTDHLRAGAGPGPRMALSAAASSVNELGPGRWRCQQSGCGQVMRRQQPPADGRCMGCRARALNSQLPFEGGT